MFVGGYLLFVCHLFVFLSFACCSVVCCFSLLFVWLFDACCSWIICHLFVLLFVTCHLFVGGSGPGEAPSPSGSVLALLESLQNAPHLEVHKDMITWILKVNADVTVMSQCIVSLI